MRGLSRGKTGQQGLARPAEDRGLLTALGSLETGLGVRRRVGHAENSRAV